MYTKTVVVFKYHVVSKLFDLDLSTGPYPQKGPHKVQKLRIRDLDMGWKLQPFFDDAVVLLRFLIAYQPVLVGDPVA